MFAGRDRHSVISLRPVLEAGPGTPTESNSHGARAGAVQQQQVPRLSCHQDGRRPWIMCQLETLQALNHSVGRSTVQLAAPGAAGRYTMSSLLLRFLTCSLASVLAYSAAALAGYDILIFSQMFGQIRTFQSLTCEKPYTTAVDTMSEQGNVFCTFHRDNTIKNVRTDLVYTGHSS